MFLLLDALFFYEDVGATNVAAAYSYADPANPTVGTNTDIAPSLDPPTLDESPAAFWGLTQPAVSAVPAGIVLPNGLVGTGVAAVTVVTDIPCELEPRNLVAACGQIKTHRFVPKGPDGEIIDVSGRALVFVVELKSGVDIETGAATQSGDPDFEISFTTQAANETIQPLRWAVRDAVTQSPIAYGTYQLQDIPKVGDTVLPGANEDLQRICESIESLEDLIDSGAKSVTQDGQTVAFDRADARKRLRQLLERKAILEAAATGASRPRKRRPLINRIDLSDRY